VKLYHGTARHNVRAMLRHGIKPRGKRGGNWKHTVDSNPNAVYLTSTYAPYFAYNAVNRSSLLGIVEIETDQLDESLLIPDEDFLEQSTRGMKWKSRLIARELRGLQLKQRTEWFRTHASFWQEHWQRSLDYLGTCAYLGTIPPAAITRGVTFDWKKNTRLGTEMVQPTITRENFKFCGDGYRAMTRWLLGDKVTADEIQGTILNLSKIQESLGAKPPAEWKPFLEAAQQRTQILEEALADRSGITVLKS
jgi:hypothetical protein